MSGSTGSDENSLHRILDTIRIAGIGVLLLHFYLHTHPRDPWPADAIGQRLTDAVANLPVVGDFLAGKSLAFLLLAVSLIGANGKKSPGHTVRSGIAFIFAGVVLFFGSGLFAGAALPYILFCSAGWLLTLYGGNYMSRVI